MKRILLVAFFLFFLSNFATGTKLVIDTDRLDENNDFIIEASEEALLEEGKWSIYCPHKSLLQIIRPCYKQL